MKGRETQRADYNAEAAAANLTALQECQKALAKALVDVINLKVELADAKTEIKDLNRRGMDWKTAIE